MLPLSEPRPGEPSDVEWSEPTLTTTGPSRRRRITLVTLGALLVLAVLYAAAYLFTSDRIPQDVTVAGVSIGGMSPEDAEDELREKVAPRLEGTVTAEVEGADGEQVEVDGAKSGVTLDIGATLDEAGAGRSLNPLRMIEVLTGGGAVDPVFATDQGALDATLDRLAKQVTEKPVQGTVEFKRGNAVAVQPEPGRTLDREATTEALQDALVSAQKGFALPTSEVDGPVSADEVDRALREFGKPAMSGPVRIDASGETVTLQPAQVGAALSMVAKDGTLVPRLDTKRLAKAAPRGMARLADEPKDASIELRNGKPVVVPSEPGTEVDMKALAKEMLEVLPRTGERVVQVKAVQSKPEFTTEDAEALGVKEVVSDATTNFPHSDYRNTNLGQAAERINGTLLKPGEEFSFNDVVGERTAANGFVPGYVISNGVLKRDYGGGVSQVATTTYNAAFFAGLKDVEHHPHSLYFDRYPMGREATVSWGSLDLRFENDSDHGVLIEAWIDPSSPSSQGTMHVRMWSTKVWDIEAGLSGQYAWTSPETRYDDSPDCEGQSPQSGFTVDVFRHFNRDGERVRTEKDTVTYNPQHEIRCGKPPKNAE